MELQCPHCGASIPAQNVNIQKTLAVCSQCNHVFEFSAMVAARKSKPRKPPKRLLIHEDGDRLELAYQRAFGAGPKFGLAMATLAAVLLSLLLITQPVKLAASPALGIILGTMTCVFWYVVAVFLTTKTRVMVDSSVVEVRSGPLPFPWSDNRTVNTREVRDVFCEDTVEEWPPALPGMPAHHVSANLFDGDRLRLMTSLPRDYAQYIAGAIDAYLQAEDPGSRLVDTGDLDTEDDMLLLDYASGEQEQRTKRS